MRVTRGRSEGEGNLVREDMLCKLEERGFSANEESSLISLVLVPFNWKGHFFYFPFATSQGRF